MPEDPSLQRLTLAFGEAARGPEPAATPGAGSGPSARGESLPCRLLLMTAGPRERTPGSENPSPVRVPWARGAGVWRPMVSVYTRVRSSEQIKERQ